MPETCSSCKFGKADGDGLIVCRRHPPQMLLIPAPPSVAHPRGGVALNGLWPKVGGDEWCGDFLPRVTQ